MSKVYRDEHGDDLDDVPALETPTGGVVWRPQIGNDTLPAGLRGELDRRRGVRVRQRQAAKRRADAEWRETVDRMNRRPLVVRDDEPF